MWKTYKGYLQSCVDRKRHLKSFKAIRASRHKVWKWRYTFPWIPVGWPNKGLLFFFFFWEIQKAAMPLSPWDDRGCISLVWEQKNHWVFNMAISNSAVHAEVKVHRQLHGSSSKCGGGLACSRSRHSAAWKGEGNQYVPIKRAKVSLTSWGILESSAVRRRTFYPVWGGHFGAVLTI